MHIGGGLSRLRMGCGRCTSPRSASTDRRDPSADFITGDSVDRSTARTGEAAGRAHGQGVRS